ncbi:peptidase S8 [Sporanaerobium hydrogeniformans]|uniref:Peptidase S8 n=1 Tax=Sporanaerobium hydrogeniformans TaxID=3072179 RepID=A0AC61DG55_9FIRM|nr:S8 family peptidase [Sporanaerobium hydrogeniformans]PHV72315.1 peptidase S8 [Sporanaerobium hydrogeniformans]
MRQSYEIAQARNYILQTFVDPTILKERYPNLLISEIAPQIVNIEVLPGGEESFQELQVNARFLTIPLLLGLNADGALAASNISVLHNYPYGELRGRGVIIGFVDTGIDYTNPLFKEANNTTRIEAIWDQTIEGSPPEGFQYGSEYLREKINEALASPDPYTVVPSRDEIGHGTFLAGVAAGKDSTGEEDYTGGAPDAIIVMVKLRPARAYLRRYYLIDDEVVAYQEDDLIAGITYLENLAIRVGRPIVFCIGVGGNFGAHNGRNITEQYLETLSFFQGGIIVIAAGNEANSGHHYSGKVESGESQTLEINVAEGENGIVLFLWSAVPNKVTISVKSPLGQVVEKIPAIPNLQQTYRFNLEKTVLSVTYIYPEPQTGGQQIRMFFDDPTPGLWSLTVYGENVVDGVYNIWLQRNGFILPDTRFLQPDPQITVQIPCTSRSPIVAGGYDYVDQSIYISSGRGPTTDNIIKPDLVAPCVNILGPTPGGGYTTFTGTSAAAAITASACALLMQWAVINGNLVGINTRIARAILIRGATRTKGVIYPNSIEGYGKLDLKNSIAQVY